jgi:hypothetical protein
MSEYEADMAVATDPILNLHSNLSKRYPKDKINKTDTYLYFNKVVAGIDAMISKDKFTIRWYKRSEGNSEIENYIRNQFKNYTKILDEPNSNGKQDMTLVLKDGSSKEVISIVDSFRTRFNQSS